MAQNTVEIDKIKDATVPIEVSSSRALSSSAKVMYGVLSSNTDLDNRVSITLETLSAITSISSRRCRILVHELEDLRLVYIHKGSLWEVNEYELLPLSCAFLDIEGKRQGRSAARQ